MYRSRNQPFLLLFLFFYVYSRAQIGTDSLEIMVKPYVGLRGQIVAYDNHLEIQDNASRFGAELCIKKGTIAFIAGAEIQLNMFKSGSIFNADANLSGGFLTLQSEQTQQVFANRLGYLGIDMGIYGKVTIGKQWSVYRDITSYTDKFNVFGAKATATFVADTDGGANGTGRADQSLIYRNKMGRLHVGTQLQMRGGNNNKFIDGFAISAQIELTDKIFIGSTYNKAFLSRALLATKSIVGLNGHPTYYAIAVQYHDNHLNVGATGILQLNGDFIQGFFKNSEIGQVNPTVVFDAKGIELFTNYKFHEFSLLAGYNLYVPSVSKLLSASTKFKRNDVIAGISYQPIKFVLVYCEQKLSLGKNSFGENENSVFVLGMKIDIANRYIRKVRL